jgi:2-polyprenyl-6-methoxyphenol hydroxylase-like FAD-dependent oxidoreductase
MTPHTPDADVIIVGGGIAGLGLACALSNYDLRILLLEKRQRSAGIHRGDSLVPKNTALLARWGILDAFYQAGAQLITHLEIYHPPQGRIYRTPLLASPDVSPYLVLPHVQIEAVLLEQTLAKGKTTLIRPANVTEVIRHPDNGRVCGVQYQTAEGNQAQVYAPLVVGTDGQQSVIRRQLKIPWQPYWYDHAYLGLEADRPPTYENAMSVHLHADGGILVMPHPQRVGVGVLVEAGRAGYWLKMSDAQLSEVLAVRAPLLAGMQLHRQGSQVYTLSRSHAPYYHVDGAVIIGDAAHATNPTAGQGMALALMDAGVLAELVGPALQRGEHNLESYLPSFQAQQWPRNQQLVRTSHWLARVYALRGNHWHRLKTAAIRFLAHPRTERLVRPVINTFLT